MKCFICGCEVLECNRSTFFLVVNGEESCVCKKCYQEVEEEWIKQGEERRDRLVSYYLQEEEEGEC